MRRVPKVRSDRNRLMGRLESATIPLPVLEEEGEEIRYLADKL